jgi:hypothetical protein
VTFSQRPHQLVSQHAWSRATGLRSHRHYTAPGTAASVLRWSCPTHRATGRLDSLVVIPHTLGNWRTCYTPSLPCPRSTTRQLASCRTAARQHPATAALLSDNCRMRTTHAPLHFSTGRNKRSFSGPHKLYRVDCLSEPRQIPQASSIYKRQTRPLVTEGAPQKQDRKCQTVINIWS